MSNPYSPPKASLESPSENSIYSEEFKREKSAIRPLGVVLVVVFFFIFSAVSAVSLMIEGDYWWVVYIATTGLLAYLFRKLWWGDDRERKFAVFVGFFAAALAALGIPEEGIQHWHVSEFSTLAEGSYCFFAACYLVYVKRHRFFESAQER